MTLSAAVVGYALLVVFLGTLTKATLGFGEAMVAVPLLTLVIGIKIAAPVMGLIGLGASLLIMLGAWREVDLRVTWRLLAAAVFGIPLGVWGIKLLPEPVVVGTLGTVLIAVGLYNLIKPALGGWEDVRWGYAFGFVAGILGGAYNMAGPPVIVYAAIRRWSPDQFRVTLQSFFFPVSTWIVLNHASAGLLTADVWLLFGLALPGMGLAIWLGGRLSARLDAQLFSRAVYGLLILLGVLLLV